MIRKAIIEGKISEVLTIDEYVKRNREDQTNISVNIDGMILPVKNKNDDGPGVYNKVLLYQVVKPSEEQSSDYSSEKMIDFNNTNTIKELIEKENRFKSMEKPILTTVNNLYKPIIGPNDSPEMVALKTALLEKNIDLDSYKHRFSSPTQFNNNKYALEEETITSKKFKLLCDVFDLKAKIIIDDKDPDVANPIGREIIVEITGGGEDD